MAVTYEGVCRMGTDGPRCMISSFTDTVLMQLSDTVSFCLGAYGSLYDIPYGAIDIVWLGPVFLIPGVDCLTFAC